VSPVKYTWLVTWRGPKGGTHKKRFNTKWQAVEFMETALFSVHPTSKTLEETR